MQQFGIALRKLARENSGLLRDTMLKEGCVMFWLIALIALIANFFILRLPDVDNDRVFETIIFFPFCNLVFLVVFYLPVIYIPSIEISLVGAGVTIYLLCHFYSNWVNKHNALIVPLSAFTCLFALQLLDGPMGGISHHLGIVIGPYFFFTVLVTLIASLFHIF